MNLVSRSWDSEVCPQSQKKRSSSAFTLSSLILSSNTMDRTQTGHVLGNPPPRDAPVVSDRQMSPVVFLLLRLLTHLAMVLGATQSPQVEHCTAQSCTSFYGSFFYSESFCLKSPTQFLGRLWRVLLVLLWLTLFHSRVLWFCPLKHKTTSYVCMLRGFCCALTDIRSRNYLGSVEDLSTEVLG